MSILSEIKDLHDSLKAFAVNIFLMPFWYVAIFLFNNEFYSSADNLIILAMTIVISFTSSGFAAFVLNQIQISNGDTEKFLNQMIVSVLILCVWLSMLIFIIYSIGFLLSIYIYFYYFLVIYFTPLLLIYSTHLFIEKLKKIQTEKK